MPHNSKNILSWNTTKLQRTYCLGVPHSYKVHRPTVLIFIPRNSKVHSFLSYHKTPNDTLPRDTTKLQSTYCLDIPQNSKVHTVLRYHKLPSRLHTALRCWPTTYNIKQTLTCALVFAEKSCVLILEAILEDKHPENARRWPNFEWILTHRLRCWANIGWTRRIWWTRGHGS